MNAFESMHCLLLALIHSASIWIPKKVFHAIGQLYAQSRCCVHTENGQSDLFNIGVYQGCILSSLLFTLAIEWVLRRATPECGIQWTNGMKLFDLDFRDEIAGPADNSQGLQTLVSNITSLAKCAGLSINTKKMKNMAIGSLSNNNVSIFINYEKVELVDSFKYLGNSMSNFGDADHKINCHIGKASAAYNQLRRIWKNQKLTLTLKMQFYRANVLLTLLCGSETWKLMTSQEKKLDVFDMKYLHQIMSIKWTDLVPNAEIRKYINQPPVSLLIHQ